MKPLTLEQFYNSKDFPEAYEFLQKQPVPERITINKKQYPVYKSFDQLTFGQVIKLREVKQDKDFSQIIKYFPIIYQPLVLSCKFDIDKLQQIEALITNCYAFEIIPSMFAYNEILSKLISNEKEKLSYEPRKEIKQADPSKLNSFGNYGILRTLSNSFKMTQEDVLQLPYILCFTELYYLTEEAKFNDRLNKILYPEK